MSDAPSNWTLPSNYSGGNLVRKRNRAYLPQNTLPQHTGGRNREAGHERAVAHATNLAKHLSSRGITAEHLETMHPNILRHHAMAAGIPDRDDRVWAMTHQLLRTNPLQQRD